MSERVLVSLMTAGDSFLSGRFALTPQSFALSNDDSKLMFDFLWRL